MRVLVIGASGQVARSLAGRNGYLNSQIVCRGRPGLDILDQTLVGHCLDTVAPDIVINTAAYTNVDGAESEHLEAYQLNAVAAGTLAKRATERDIPLIHLSTDYVFDGRKDTPYLASDPANPLSIYGQTKLQGEYAVAANAPNHLIVRTAWIYSPYGKNFVKTMLGLARARERVSVVDDQIGHPTFAPDLAKALLDIAKGQIESPFRAGAIHLAGANSTSWAGFAKAVFKISEGMGGPSAEVCPIPSCDYPALAARPSRVELDMSQTKEQFGVALRGYEDALPDVISNLVSKHETTPK